MMTMVRSVIASFLMIATTNAPKRAPVAATSAVHRPIPGAHNIWEIVLHVGVWESIVRRRLSGEVVRNVPPELSVPVEPSTRYLVSFRVRCGGAAGKSLYARLYFHNRAKEDRQ